MMCNSLFQGICCCFCFVIFIPHVLYYCKKFDSFGLVVCHSYGCVGFVEGFLWKLYCLSKPKSLFNPIVCKSILKMYFYSDFHCSCWHWNEDVKSTHLTLSMLWSGCLKCAATGKLTLLSDGLFFVFFYNYWT